MKQKQEDADPLFDICPGRLRAAYLVARKLDWDTQSLLHPADRLLPLWRARNEIVAATGLTIEAADKLLDGLHRTGLIRVYRGMYRGQGTVRVARYLEEREQHLRVIQKVDAEEPLDHLDAERKHESDEPEGEL